jgi:N-formylglutamate amidohydrolase
MIEYPIVLHIPHSSHCIPDFLREEILLNDEELQQNLYAFTDWNTQDLFSHREFPCRVISNISRMVCDMERFRDDSQEEMALHGFGAVYTKDAFLRPLRTFDRIKRELILRLYYDPHHKALENAVSDMVKKHGKCLIVDCHSFSGTPLPYEPEQETNRPDFCIGTVSGHTDGHLVKTALKVLQTPNVSVALNYPYSGSMLPVKFGGDARVQTIMIEVNRTLYQKQNSFLPLPGYADIKNKTGRLLLALSAEF